MYSIFYCEDDSVGDLGADAGFNREVRRSSKNSRLLQMIRRPLPPFPARSSCSALLPRSCAAKSRFDSTPKHTSVATEFQMVPLSASSVFVCQDLDYDLIFVEYYYILVFKFEHATYHDVVATRWH